MAENTDMRILYDGIEGKTSIDEKSGLNIKNDLIGVTRKLNDKKNRPRIIVDLDEIATSTALSASLKKIIDSLKIEPVKIKFDVSNDIKQKSSKDVPFNNFSGASVSTKSMTQATAELIKVKIQNIQLETAESQSHIRFINRSKERVQSIKEETAVVKSKAQINKLALQEAKNLSSEISKRTNYNNSLNTLDQKVAQIGAYASTEDQIAKAKLLASEYERLAALNTKVQAVDLNNLVGNTDAIKYYNQDVNSLTTGIKKLQNSTGIASKDKSFENKILDDKAAMQNLELEFEKFKRLNDKFYNGNKDRIDGLGGKIASAIDAGDFKQVAQFRAELKSLNIEMQRTGQSGQSFFAKLQAQMSKLGVYFSAAGLMMGAFNQVKNMIRDVVELDGAVTDLQIATGGTREETEKLLDTYSKLGKEIGATTLDVATSADTWLRQGKSIEDTNTLIKDSIVLSKLGKINSEEAAQALTSSMKGYKLEVSEAIGAVDKFTAIDKDAAVSAGYLAKAIAETATGARLGGVEMDRLAGYIALVGETTQDGAESVGIFFKSMFARMGNIKEGKLIDPETQEDISTVESTLGNLGIKLRENGSEFRNYGDILDEVAAKWSGLSDVNRQALAVAFGQTRNQEKFLTLMDGYSTAMGYAETAANSAGTAMSKYENSYLPSVEASQERFTAQFEALSRTVIDSGIITDTIDSGTGLLGTLTAITGFLKPLPTLITVAAGAVSGLTNKGGLKIKSSKMYLRPFAADGNIGQDQYEYGVLCLGAA